MEVYLNTLLSYFDTYLKFFWSCLCSGILVFVERTSYGFLFFLISDFEDIQVKCQKKRLDDQHVTPQQVEITRSILVKSVTDEITKDNLELHFDNKNRSGGEGVEEVEMMPDVQMAIVKFEDHKG